MELHSLPSGKNMLLAEVSASSSVREVEKPECGSLHSPENYYATF